MEGKQKPEGRRRNEEGNNSGTNEMIVLFLCGTNFQDAAKNLSIARISPELEIRFSSGGSSPS